MPIARSWIRHVSIQLHFKGVTSASLVALMAIAPAIPSVRSAMAIHGTGLLDTLWLYTLSHIIPLLPLDQSYS